MKKTNKKPTTGDMQAEYDFRGGKRGVYASRFAAGTNIVALEPDVAKAFPDSEAVNKALRGLINRPKPKGKRKVG